jgi:CheY-like chemotaxis protein/GAF domain-containing protein
LSKTSKFLLLCENNEARADLPFAAGTDCELTEVHSPLRALVSLRNQSYDGLIVASKHLKDALTLGKFLQNDRILAGMPDGVALIDADNKIVWANQRLQQWCGGSAMVGQNFYSALNSPEILGPDFCPFHTALVMGQPSNSTLRVEENTYYQVHAAPVVDGEDSPTHLIVTVRDVTTEKLQQHKLAAIHKAGIELADLSPEEVFNMEVQDRIELLKSNIIHFTQHLLNFDVVEIRLLDEKSGKLTSLLASGLDPEAAERALCAQPQNNGVTGFVAATGKSYLCEDTGEDPLYLEGFKGAKSSLTVPLVWHDHVIGTFNVESPEPGAFSESDLQFLEIFSRDVAVALNTLELLIAQQANTAQESVEAIHSAVALPIDEILNDTVNLLERYIGHDAEAAQHLQAILRNARDIKQVIQSVGQRMAPTEAVPSGVKIEERPKLQSRRVLVVDEDPSVRGAAHALLERYGCIVETAHNGAECISMSRNCGPDGGCYDAIISDIRLPDMSGFDLLMKFKDYMDPVPLILMTGFGYDPGHSIVKARQAGLHPKAILYKPFRLDQLVEIVETILDSCGEVTIKR